MTPLQKTLKRALTINGRDYVIAISPDGLKVVPKGKRKGIELQWEALVSGEAALAAALQASVGQFEPSASQRTSRPKPLPREGHHVAAKADAGSANRHRVRR
jgi:hypothetical protein